VLGAGLNSCDNSVGPKTEKAKYEVVSEQVVAKGYSGAQGLTSNKKYLGKKLAKNSSTESKVFCTEPTLDGRNGGFLTYPEVYTFSEGSPQLVYTFGSENLDDFSTWGMASNLQPTNLVIDAVLTQGDSIFYTTNVSDKLFLINNGAKEIYLQNQELIGTSSIIKGKDGKLYLGQVPKKIGGDTLSTETKINKRVLSVNKDKSINTEFEIPEVEEELHGGVYKVIEAGQHVSIAEADSGEFYLTDFCGDRVYKWTKESGLEVFLENAEYPQSLDITSDGDLLILTAPRVDYFDFGEVWTPNKNAEIPPKLKILNKQTKEETIINEFPDLYASYWNTSGPSWETNKYGKKELISFMANPLSSTLEESLNLLKYYMTKPVKGEVIELEITKEDTTSN